jgi:ubiquinone/menaquinone biosynthesis C-methylase UbiE
MLSRRKIIGSTVMAASVLPTLGWGKSLDFQPRGTVGKLERLPSLDLESRDDFNMSYRIQVNGALRKAAMDRASAILKANGININAEVPLKQAVALFENDPVLAANMHGYVRGQQVMWSQLRDAIYANGDALMAEMETADKTGPGVLELNPRMALPDYTKEEIHNQPGGYVGDEFAGHIYYYGTNNFWMGHNYQDEMHAKLAAETPIPADGKVRRILDVGCGDGRLTLALQQRFPDAEVWGIDVGGPMVRFSHMRANEFGNKANYAQRLAENTGFPDGHFDIVTSFLLFHEVSGAANKQIIAETARILRTGGVFAPGDIRTSKGVMTGYRQFFNWWNTRWNHEVWMLQHIDTDYEKVFAANGFTWDANEKTRFGGSANAVGVKKA